MSIGANNDDSELRQRPGYRNTEFLITTGMYTPECLDSSCVCMGKGECTGLGDLCHMTAMWQQLCVQLAITLCPAVWHISDPAVALLAQPWQSSNIVRTI